MMKFAPLMIAAAAALSSLAGCASQTAPEMTAEDTAAVCNNPDGTNAGIAALAVAITQELHRWNLTSDFSIVSGYNGQQVLALTQAGLNACGGSCPLTANILGMQDSRMDQKVVFGNQKMSSWTFASRLVTGFQNQVSCQQNNKCPFVAHMFTYSPATTTPGACDTLFTFPVVKPGFTGSLTPAQVSQLANALVWTAPTGINPYVAFQATADTVTIDPTGNLNPPGQTTGAEICQKASLTNIAGTPCTCAANNIYSNGQLLNDQPMTPKTYYCRQM